MSIASVLFTKTQRQILALLYGQPESSFYLNEIVRLTDVGKGAIARNLKKMTDTGLLSTYRQGNQTHYQANPNNPIYEELKAITRKTFGVVEVISQALTSLHPRIYLAFIYGSIAKGTDHAASDVDVFLVGDDLSYSEVMETLEPAENQLQRTVNPTIFTQEEFSQRESAQNHFVTQVMAGPKLWLKQPSSQSIQE